MKKQGVTVIGILIVVAIIGILVAIAMPGFLKARSISHANACAESLLKMESAMHGYALENAIPLGQQITPSSLIGPAGYIKSIPACPDNGSYTWGVIGQAPTCSVHTSKTLAALGFQYPKDLTRRISKTARKSTVSKFYRTTNSSPTTTVTQAYK